MKPWFSAPSWFSSGISTSSMWSSAVSLARMPSLPCIAVWLKPFMPRSSTKAVMPFWALDASVLARTT
jgi:hypothetical protein